MDFGEWLEKELRDRNLSMSSLARSVGVSPGTVSRWTHGQRRPEHEFCERIAWVLDYPPEFVLVKAGHEPYPKERQEQLRLELEQAQTRASTIDSELANLQREREQLTEKIEQIYTELDRIQTADDRDPTDESLQAIDQLPLADEIKDRLRNIILDAAGEKENSRASAANDH